MKLTLGEKLFAIIPGCVLLLIVVDATWTWTSEQWFAVCYEFVSGYILWIIWENRHTLRNQHGHAD